MLKRIAILPLVALTATLVAQAPARPKSDSPAFEVATIKPIEHDARGGRYFKMTADDRFVAKDYTLKLLIAAAFDLNPKTISGGPDWVDSEHFDILAITPGSTRPSRERQMAMLRNLITDRFQLTFHREQKEFSIYQLEVAKDGPKLKPAANPDAEAAVISSVYPDNIHLPARSASMHDFVSMMQRALLDRPVVDKTNLAGRYDFDLEWAPDETQFGGEVPVAPTDAPALPLFIALQQQLGLKLVATRGPIDALVIDHAGKPTEN